MQMSVLIGGGVITFTVLARLHFLLATDMRPVPNIIFKRSRFKQLDYV
jgi:hypothetical protein